MRTIDAVNAGHQRGDQIASFAFQCVAAILDTVETLASPPRSLALSLPARALSLLRELSLSLPPTSAPRLRRARLILQVHMRRLLTGEGAYRRRRQCRQPARRSDPETARSPGTPIPELKQNADLRIAKFKN